LREGRTEGSREGGREGGREREVFTGGPGESKTRERRGRGASENQRGGRDYYYK